MQQTLDKKHIKINENIKECSPLGRNVFLLVLCGMFIETFFTHSLPLQGSKKKLDSTSHFEQAAFKFSLPLASLSLVEGQLALTFFYWESRKGKTAYPCQLDETYSQPVKQLLFMFLCGQPLTTWNCYMPITKLPAICRLQ